MFFMWGKGEIIISFGYLDAEDKVTEVIAGGGGGVATHDLLAVDVGHDRDMLADGQVQHIILVRKRKLVPESFMVEKRSKKNILCE